MHERESYPNFELIFLKKKNEFPFEFIFYFKFLSVYFQRLLRQISASMYTSGCAWWIDSPFRNTCTITMPDRSDDVPCRLMFVACTKQQRSPPRISINEKPWPITNSLFSLKNYSYLNYELSLFQNIDQIFVPVIHSVVVLSNYWINPNWVDM